MREEVPAALAGERLDRVISFLTGRPRSEVANLIAAGRVQLRGKAVTNRSRRVGEGDVLEVDLPAANAPSLPEPDPGVAFNVVHEDAAVVVVDKPAGLVVHPGAGREAGTLVNGLLARYPELVVLGDPLDPTRPGIVHRLDAGTSGLLVVARTPHAYHDLVDQLSSRTVDRYYFALVLGAVASDAGVVDAPVGRARDDATRMAVAATGRDARTHYRVRSRYEHPTPLTLLECSLETGRTHQIRVHLAAIGHPVAGDDRYGGVRPSLELPRPFLHAHHLEFTHPTTRGRVAFDAPLPPDLAAVLAQLS